MCICVREAGCVKATDTGIILAWLSGPLVFRPLLLSLKHGNSLKNNLSLFLKNNNLSLWAVTFENVLSFFCQVEDC